VNSSTRSPHVSRPPTEVTAKAKRRKFTAEYKQKVLAEADACDRGGLGALLRREGLYSSHLVEWRRARDAGQLAALTPKRRGPKAETNDPVAQKLAAVEREVARLKAENAKLQLICDVQKKVSLLLGLTLPTVPDDDKTSGSSS
jgi:transposase